MRYGRGGDEGMCSRKACYQSELYSKFVHCAAAARPHCSLPRHCLRVRLAFLLITSNRIQAHFQQIITRIHVTEMIRRSPTQIDMTDLDVQDIRDHIASEIAQENQAKTRAVSEANAAAYADAAAAATRAMEKERRLGIRCTGFHTFSSSRISEYFHSA